MWSSNMHRSPARCAFRFPGELPPGSGCHRDWGAFRGSAAALGFVTRPPHRVGRCSGSARRRADAGPDRGERGRLFAQGNVSRGVRAFSITRRPRKQEKLKWDASFELPHSVSHCLRCITVVAEEGMRGSMPCLRSVFAACSDLFPTLSLENQPYQVPFISHPRRHLCLRASPCGSSWRRR